MNYEIISLPHFRREIKKLAKKYPSIKDDFTKLLISLQEKPNQGTSIGNNCYKIRMAITSKGKGKSSGSRVITFVKIANKSVYLLSIYDKSNQENISNKELRELLDEIPN